MNGTLDGIRVLVDGIARGASQACPSSIAVCPPFVYVDFVRNLLAGSDIGLGAQDVAETEPGAYTGEVAAEMLAELGCRYAIVGHSERRSLYNESSVTVAKKCKRLLATGVTPIVCVGEQLEERESGATEDIVAAQLDCVLEEVEVGMLRTAVIAYEPVWAIGTGLTATPEQANAVHSFVRTRVAKHDRQVADEIRILYGGSVKPSNAQALFSMSDIDGGLIGGASLDAEDFLAICTAAR